MLFYRDTRNKWCYLGGVIYAEYWLSWSFEEVIAYQTSDRGWDWILAEDCDLIKGRNGKWHPGRGALVCPD